MSEPTLSRRHCLSWRRNMRSGRIGHKKGGRVSEEKKADIEAALTELEWEIGLAIRQDKMPEHFLRTAAINEGGKRWVMSLVVQRLLDDGDSSSGSARS